MKFLGIRKLSLVATFSFLFGLIFTDFHQLLAWENDLGKYIGFEAKGDITRFEGETLHYDISFLWFENAASAKVQF